MVFYKSSASNMICKQSENMTHYCLPVLCVFDHSINICFCAFLVSSAESVCHTFDTSFEHNSVSKDFVLHCQFFNVLLYWNFVELGPRFKFNSNCLDESWTLKCKKLIPLKFKCLFKLKNSPTCLVGILCYPRPMVLPRGLYKLR